MGTDPPDRNSRRLEVDKIRAESESQSFTEDNVEDRRFALDEHKTKAAIAKDRQAQAQGAVGKILGDREHAPVYVACTAFIVLVVVLGCLAVFHEESRSSVIEVGKAIIFGVLGYFAGIKRSTN